MFFSVRDAVLLAALVLPENIRYAGRFVDMSRHDEQQVGEAIQIFQRDGVNLFDLCQAVCATFGAPTDGTCLVAGRCCRTSAGQDEFF